MPVVPVDPDLLVRHGFRGIGAVGVIGREHRGGRADRIHQGHREERRRARQPAEDGAVEVGQGRVRLLGVVAPGGQVLGDLPVRQAVGELDRTAEVAQERHVGGRSDQRDAGEGGESGGRDGDAAALAAAGDDDLVRVDLGQRAGGVEQAYGVGVDPAVVVVLRVGDPGRHEAGRVVQARRRCPVGGAARAARAPALAAGVHHQVGVAGLGPGRGGVREAAAAGVAVVLHDRGQRAGGAGGSVQPGLDRGAPETGVADVVGLDQGELVLVRRPAQREVVAARLGQRVGPERHQVRRDRDLRCVGLELGQRQVEERHRQILFKPLDEGRAPMIV